MLLHKLNFKIFCCLANSIDWFSPLLFQVLELITKQTGLMRDRQLLAREVEFLRRNISKNNQDELNKFVSSNKLLVDEVLDNIRVEDMEKRDYVTNPKSVNMADLWWNIWYMAELFTQPNLWQIKSNSRLQNRWGLKNWSLVRRKGEKTKWDKEKVLVTSIFSVYHFVFKRIYFKDINSCLPVSG